MKTHIEEYLAVEKELDALIADYDTCISQEGFKDAVLSMGKKVALKAAKLTKKAGQKFVSIAISIFDELGALEYDLKRYAERASKQEGETQDVTVSFRYQNFLPVNSDKIVDLESNLDAFKGALPTLGHISKIVKEVKKFSKNLLAELAGLSDLNDFDEKDIYDSLDRLNELVLDETKKFAKRSDALEVEDSETCLETEGYPGNWSIAFKFDKRDTLVETHLVENKYSGRDISDPKAIQKDDIPSLVNSAVGLSKAVRGLRDAADVLYKAETDLNLIGTAILEKNLQNHRVNTAFHYFEMSLTRILVAQRRMYMWYLYNAASTLNGTAKYIKASSEKIK